MNSELNDLANQNWKNLTECTYFGRIIIAGVSYTGNYLYFATAISGRSPGSKNRRYVVDEHHAVRTDVVDQSLGVGNQELTLYATQMQMHGDKFAISNGCQTADALQFPSRPLLLGDVLSGYEFEPDAPINTNRITARCRIVRGRPPQDERSPLFEFATHSPTEYGTTLISSTRPERIKKGYSLFLATYDGDGDPPYRFVGGPRLLPTSEIDALEKIVIGLSRSNDFLVAVSFKTVEIETGDTTVSIWNHHGDK